MYEYFHYFFFFLTEEIFFPKHCNDDGGIRHIKCLYMYLDGQDTKNIDKSDNSFTKNNP